MPGEEGWISGLVPLCRLNHRRFLVPRAGLYKAQTAAGFSTLLPWNWMIMKPDRGFRHHQLASSRDPLLQVSGHLSSFAHACRSPEIIGRRLGGGETRLETWCASKPTFVVLCQGWQKSPDRWPAVRPQLT